MKLPPVFSSAYRQVQRPVQLLALLTIGIVFSILFPSDLDSYPIRESGTTIPAVVEISEHYLRYVPTVVQVGLPILLRDKIGMVQFLYVALSTTVATHTLKRVLNDRYVFDTRLGQRPSRAGSKQNMPSGHSSMASCAVYYVGKRYSFRLALFLTVFLLLAMFARVMLNDHTISAVVAGALLGVFTAAIFTSKLTELTLRTTWPPRFLRKHRGDVTQSDS